ncbi:unnamed protein product [Cochlearia groenlandica]
MFPLGARGFESLVSVTVDHRLGGEAYHELTDGDLALSRSSRHSIFDDDYVIRVVRSRNTLQELTIAWLEVSLATINTLRVRITVDSRGCPLS